MGEKSLRSDPTDHPTPETGEENNKFETQPLDLPDVQPNLMTPKELGALRESERQNTETQLSDARRELDSATERQIGQQILAELSRQENPFDQRTAEQVLTVIQDWIRCGGSFYEHLTGKDPNVEYKPKPGEEVVFAGKPQSYWDAVKREVDAWLEDPDSSAWLEGGKRFIEENQVSNEGDEKGGVQAAPFCRMKKGFWLRYDSNYLIEGGNGEKTARQPEKEKAENRVYINVKGRDVMGTLQELIGLFEKDSDLQKLGFSAKTTNIGECGSPPLWPNDSADRMGSLINQKDKIVFYFGAKGIEKALPILREYAEQNPQKFDQEGILFAQSLTDSRGKEFPGIRLATESDFTPTPSSAKMPRNYYESFSQRQEFILENCFASLIEDLRDSEARKDKLGKLTKATVKKLRDFSLTTTPDGKINWQGEDLKGCLEIILSDKKNGRNFLLERLQQQYPHWAEEFGMRTDNIAFAEPKK